MRYFALIFSLFLYSSLLTAQELKETDVPSAVVSSFKDKYTPEGKVSWFTENTNFSASFKSQGQNVKVDFSEDGKWIDTKYNIDIKELPAEISSYINTDFKDAKIKESSLRESSTEDNHYYIVLKKENVTSTAELFFDMKGNMIRKNVPDDFLNSSANSLLVNVPAAVTNAFKAKFPGATVSSWKSDSVYTAFFVNDGTSGRAAFNDTAKWLFTKYAIPEKELPSPVASEIKNSCYGYRLKVSEMVEEPGVSTYYYIYAKKDGINQPSIELFFSIAGKLLKKVSSLDNDLDEGTEINNNSSNTSNSNVNNTTENNEESGTTTEKIEIRELPSPVTTYIKKNYQGYLIKEASLVSSGNESIYDVKIKKEGKKKLTELTFDTKGKFLEVIGGEDEE